MTLKRTILAVLGLSISSLLGPTPNNLEQRTNTDTEDVLEVGDIQHTAQNNCTERFFPFSFMSAAFAGDAPLADVNPLAPYAATTGVLPVKPGVYQYAVMYRLDAPVLGTCEKRVARSKVSFSEVPKTFRFEAYPAINTEVERALQGVESTLIHMQFETVPQGLAEGLAEIPGVSNILGAYQYVNIEELALVTSEGIRPLVAVSHTVEGRTATIFYDIFQLAQHRICRLRSNGDLQDIQQLSEQSISDLRGPLDLILKIMSTSIARDQSSIDLGEFRDRTLRRVTLHLHPDGARARGTVHLDTAFAVPDAADLTVHYRLDPATAMYVPSMDLPLEIDTAQVGSARCDFMTYTPILLGR